MMDKERTTLDRHTGYRALLMGALLFAFCLPFSALAEDPPRVLGWQDLKVAVEFDDPFVALNGEQLMKLSLYARVEEMLENRPDKVSEGMVKESKEAKVWLAEQGIDVDGLLAKREEITMLRTKRAMAMDETLDGVAIRMPGYALALEYDGKKVKEFLLVPWVGACIHTPPPPPNQIVYVQAAEAFAVSSRFEPVWIEGVIHVGETSKSLYLVDGSSDINVGYSMTGVAVEKYKAGPKAQARPADHAKAGKQ